MVKSVRWHAILLYYIHSHLNRWHSVKAEDCTYKWHVPLWGTRRRTEVQTAACQTARRVSDTENQTLLSPTSADSGTASQCALSSSNPEDTCRQVKTQTGSDRKYLVSWLWGTVCVFRWCQTQRNIWSLTKGMSWIISFGRKNKKRSTWFSVSDVQFCTWLCGKKQLQFIVMRHEIFLVLMSF